ncbi:MAG: site-specific integrase [Lachnospiraceae bacterium]|nr:site-specific integrase [Lachnospiraceae bacterium]
MATAKKLPSGSWNVQIFSHYEYIQQPDGSIKKKRIYESFTCDDPSTMGKWECERMAAEWAYTRKDRGRNITVGEAISRYIAAKEGTLSPSTIAGYMKYADRYYGEISGTSIRDLNREMIQLWISSLCSSVSPKTISNVYGLFNAAVSMFREDFHPKVSLPQKRQYKGYTPTDADILALMEQVQKDEELLAFLLMSISGLRRSESCAVRREDIGNNCIHVSRSKVRDKDGYWVIKDMTKTASSTRDVPMPQKFIDLLPDHPGYLIKSDPDSMDRKFRRAVADAGLPKFTPHRCRHYFASICHALGIPDVYVMSFGGWKTTSVMNRIYREELKDVSSKQATILTGHFTEMTTVQDKMQDGSL